MSITLATEDLLRGFSVFLLTYFRRSGTCSRKRTVFMILKMPFMRHFMFFWY